MEVPPTYPQMAPRRNSNAKLIWGIVIAVVCVCCLGVVGLAAWGFSKFKKALPLFGCAYRMEDIHSAVLRYANSHDGKLPNAKSWQDDIQSDLSDVNQTTGAGKRPFGTVKPGDDFSCSFDNISTGIAYNSDLSGKKLADIKNASTTILLFEIRSVMKNSAQPYKPSTDTAPAVMGMARGWLTAPVEGHTTVFWANQRLIMNDEKFGPAPPAQQ